jgi:hypothetical protein
MALSADGKIVATGWGASVSLWDVSDLIERQEDEIEARRDDAQIRALLGGARWTLVNSADKRECERLCNSQLP